jgi:hypothetical protein
MLMILWDRKANDVKIVSTKEEPAMTPSPEQLGHWDRDLARIEGEAREALGGHQSWCVCAGCLMLDLVRDARWQLGRNTAEPDIPTTKETDR